MQLDKTMLDRLLALDDITLAKTITALAAAAGIDQHAAESAVQNLRLVRASLSNATEADLKNAAAMLGEKRLAAMQKQLKETQDGK